MKFMDSVDKTILKAINKVSPKSFVSPVKVNEVLKLDTTLLGDRLMILKKTGHVDISISDYPSSLTLPNSISKVYLTNLGRAILEVKEIGLWVIWVVSAINRTKEDMRCIE
jgi:hypothetical protein